MEHTRDIVKALYVIIVFLAVVHTKHCYCTMMFFTSKMLFTLQWTRKRHKGQTSSKAVLHPTDMREGIREAMFLVSQSKVSNMLWETCDILKTKRFQQMFVSYWTSATVLPVIPVFENPLFHPPDVDLVFPDMRYEDSRFASFSGGQNSHVNQFATVLARDGYYYDDIYQEVRCFYCGCVYNDHIPRCSQMREQCNIPFSHCWTHREERLQQQTDLHVIIRSPGFTLRDQDVNRGSTRQTQTTPTLSSVSCCFCPASPCRAIVYSCNHRARSCDSCFRLQSRCPYCGGGNSDNPVMREYNRRTSVTTPGDHHTCLSCRSRRSSVLLLPCRHLVVCSPCSREVELCPLCGTSIAQSSETFQ